jgi:predicted TIM-barrel fold metal-dependent hydrolase
MNDLMRQRTTGPTRRAFIASSCAALVAAGCKSPEQPTTRPTQDSGLSTGDSIPIIDLHQHTNYNNRTDEQLIAHQRNMGISLSVLLPAGHPVETPTTHMGKSNGLAAKCFPIESCYALVRNFPDRFTFFANEVPDQPNARAEIEKYLKAGAKGIGELKFNLEVDSPPMQMIYAIAADYGVPVLMHFQFETYNLAYDRFWRVLEKHAKTNFIGHAQTFWANIDANHTDQKVLYPKTKVTPGGMTDRYLSNYPNFYADMSAGSGLGALLRDEDQAKEFLRRHQDKCVYGSDCDDIPGKLPTCQGAQTIVAIKRLAPDPVVRRKIFHDNAVKLLRLS